MNFNLNSFKFSKYLFMKSSIKPLDLMRNCYINTTLCSNKNPFMEKYASKIAEVRKMSQDDFKITLEENLKPTENNALCSKPIFDKKEIKISSFQRQKDLNQIMKLEVVQNKSAQEIESIWKEYHSVKDGVYAVLPTNSYEKMYSNFKEYPVFLFPLPRPQGYEFIMCQFLDQSWYFTSLINYQAFKENAPICLTVTYFTEFHQEKGIVLMRGEYDSSLKASEAQCLTNQLQLYYGGKDEEKTRLLWKFNKQPEAFKHTDLLSNFDSGLCS